MTYGTGSVSGQLASDTLHIGPLSPTLTFGLASIVSEEFVSYPMDGILGLGRSPNQNTTSLLSTLSTSNLIPANLFALHLNRRVTSSSSSPSSSTTTTTQTTDGELTLGALNPARFTGSINYTPLLPSPSNFWEITLDAASLNNNNNTPIIIVTRKVRYE